MATKVPAYSFSNGSHSSKVVDGYWYIYLKASGTLKLTYAKSDVEVFLVGGGGGGCGGWSNACGGGGGGYVKTVKGVSIAGGTNYSIVVGAGGAKGASGGGDYENGGHSNPGSDGKQSSAFGYVAAGGKGGDGNGGDGGSGGGAGNHGNGGSDGSNGGNGEWQGVTTYGGKGQDSTSGYSKTTREFGEADGKLYAGGGGGGANTNDSEYGKGGDGGGGDGGTSGRANGSDGTANTGGGGGGARGVGNAGGKGGSGIVIIRGKEDDFTPVYFNGRQLSKIYFNGELLKGLVYGGTRIFAQAIQRTRMNAMNTWKTAGV